MIGFGNWLLFFFGFADLYFGIFDKSVCLDTELLQQNMAFRTWLLVDGIVRVGFGIILGFTFVFYFKQYMIEKLFTVISIILGIAYVIFIFVWGIKGINMFWGNLIHQKTCGDEVSLFVWINLIVYCIIMAIIGLALAMGGK